MLLTYPTNSSHTLTAFLYNPKQKKVCFWQTFAMFWFPYDFSRWAFLYLPLALQRTANVGKSVEIVYDELLFISPPTTRQKRRREIFCPFPSWPVSLHCARIPSYHKDKLFGNWKNVLLCVVEGGLGMEAPDLLIFLTVCVFNLIPHHTQIARSRINLFHIFLLSCRLQSSPSSSVLLNYILNAKLNLQ